MSVEMDLSPHCHEADLHVAKCIDESINMALETFYTISHKLNYFVFVISKNVWKFSFSYYVIELLF